LKEPNYAQGERMEPRLDDEPVAPDDAASTQFDEAAPASATPEDTIVAAEVLPAETAPVLHKPTLPAVIPSTLGEKLARAALFAGGALIAMVVGAAGAMWLMEYQKQEHAADMVASNAAAVERAASERRIAPTEAAAADPADFIAPRPDTLPPIVTLPPDAASVAAAAAAAANAAAPGTVPAATPAPTPSAATVAKPVLAMAIVKTKPAKLATAANVAPQPLAKPKTVVKKPVVAKGPVKTVSKTPKAAAKAAAKPPVKTVAKAAVSPPKLPLINERDDKRTAARTRDAEREPVRDLPPPRQQARELPPPRDDSPSQPRCPPGSLARDCVN
jgi:hypothetical protein